MTDDEKRERRNAAALKYYHANRDRLLAAQKQRNATRREFVRARARKYYQQHGDAKRAAAKRRRDVTHREVVKAQKAASAKRNIVSVRAYHRKWEAANRKRLNEQNRQHRWRLKLRIIAAYGGACRCCGEETPEFLTVDHIDGNGAVERRQGAQGTGDKFYRWLIKQGYPKNNYRLLCFNCNCSRGLFGRCPHELRVDAAVADVVA